MTAHADDDRLVRALRGSRSERDAALRELFERTRGALYNLALRMSGRADLADDVVQETFVDVLRGIDTFRGDARLDSWVYRIAIRAAVRIDARSRRREDLLPNDAQPTVSAHEDPSRVVEQRESADRILDALRALPARHRAVLALAALDDLPQTEIAAILGIPIGTVYSRIHAARERLRRVLDS